MKHNSFCIYLMADGWEVTKNGTHLCRWDHNEEDLGTEAIADLIENITGKRPEIQEVY